MHFETMFFLGKPSKKKNCDYSDIVPISFYTHPPEGDRDSNYRDKINVISTPPSPLWWGGFSSQRDVGAVLSSTNFAQMRVWGSGFRHPPPEVYVPIIISFIIGIMTEPPPS